MNMAVTCRGKGKEYDVSTDHKRKLEYNKRKAYAAICKFNR